MKVGFIGLGIMGMPMSINISKKYEVKGYDVVSKEAPYPIVSSIKELVEWADVIVSMVPKNEHVKSVYSEVVKYLTPGMICIDMSTILPSVNVEVSSWVEEKGCHMLDCPVVKSQPAAVAGTLGIYVGGEERVYNQVKDILSCMGNNIIYMGEQGKGLVMKIIHNSLVAQIQNGVNEVMTLATNCGIDPKIAATAISYGGGQNFYLDTKVDNIKNHQYKTAFSIENMNKDAHFAYDLMKELGLDLPGIKTVNEIYEEAMELDMGKLDFSSTYEIVSRKED